MRTRRKIIEGELGGVSNNDDKINMALKSIIRDVADTKMRAWKKQMASLPRHRQLEAERMQVFF